MRSNRNKDRLGNKPVEIFTSKSPTIYRVAVMKGSSLAVGWALSQGSKEAYWRLYKAVWAGTKGEDCMVTYPVNGNTCQIFHWQKQNFMNTQYDHVEL